MLPAWAVLGLAFAPLSNRLVTWLLWIIPALASEESECVSLFVDMRV